MQIELVRIGNSRGVRIPKSVIEQCGFGDKIDMKIEEGRLILARDRKPREGWREALVHCEQTLAGDELLLDGILENEFDATEWTW